MQSRVDTKVHFVAVVVVKRRGEISLKNLVQTSPEILQFLLLSVVVHLYSALPSTKKGTPSRMEIRGYYSAGGVDR